MERADVEQAFEEFEPDRLAGGQFLPSAVGEARSDDAAGAAPDAVLERLREDLRRVAADLAAVDRRDAAQHGGLRGEIAHLVRRIARLEAQPRTRQAR